MKLVVKAENSNYAAEVIKLSKPYPHPNAQKLQLVNHRGNVVITSLEAKENNIYIYFPLECAINKEYLAWSNSFAKSEDNRDTKVKGFFNEHGRVRAVKLRGQPSMGYIVPAQDILNWCHSKGIKAPIEDFVVGTEFDHIDDIKICEKYINKVALQKSINVANANKKKGKVKRTSKLVDNQFRFHIDTAPIKKNIQVFNPEDMITVSYKLHGCSIVLSNVLVKRKLPVKDRIAKWFGVKVEEVKYDYLWSSRRVIKNAYEENHKQNIHYYDSDIWSITAKIVNTSIKPGITLYGELVGQTPTGSWIQKDYCYGTQPKQQDFYVYRVTSTNYSGDVIEFTTEQVQRYCSMYGLKMVPILYRGKAKDLFPELSLTEHWNQNFLDALIKKYTEKDCYMCKNKVPEEGAIISIDREVFTAFKLKSFRFLQRESLLLDAGEIDSESVESVPETVD